MSIPPSRSADAAESVQSLIGKAIAYAVERWEGLCVNANNGQLEMDNNLVEKRIRPVALGRKNYLFTGSDEYAQHLTIDASSEQENYG